MNLNKKAKAAYLKLLSCFLSIELYWCQFLNYKNTLLTVIISHHTHNVLPCDMRGTATKV